MNCQRSGGNAEPRCRHAAEAIIHQRFENLRTSEVQVDAVVGVQNELSLPGDARNVGEAGLRNISP
jgi:hypothetical protein